MAKRNLVVQPGGNDAIRERSYLQALASQ